MKLNELKIGETGIIEKVLGVGAVRKRLLDMGLTPKTNVTLFKRAPMGDPVEVIIRGYHLTLRVSDADNIIVREKAATE